MVEEDPSLIKHIDIAKETNLFLVAPASANTIAKLAHGMADTLLWPQHWLYQLESQN